MCLFIYVIMCAPSVYLINVGIQSLACVRVWCVCFVSSCSGAHVNTSVECVRAWPLEVSD